MEPGIFLEPSHPPERGKYEGLMWDRQVLRWADEYGYSEAWIGEHYASPWEPGPAPDLLIAQALLETSNPTPATGAHLLPYHPAQLAHRVAYLDHMAAQGRLIFGVGSSGLPGDWQLFDVDAFAGENRRMTAESLDMILWLWDTLSVGLSPRYLASHWESVQEGADGAGSTPDRSQWRVLRQILIADTDAEARRLAVDGMTGRHEREYFTPLFTRFGMIDNFKHDSSVPDDAVTPDHLVDSKQWMVGGPETDAEMLAEVYEVAGGCGTLIQFCWDDAEDAEAWRYSMEGLATEVLPKLAHLSPAGA